METPSLFHNKDGIPAFAFPLHAFLAIRQL
jgi:hypothetical protein